MGPGAKWSAHAARYHGAMPARGVPELSEGTGDGRGRHGPAAREVAVREAGRRAPWGSISRGQVIDAAIDALARGTYEQMTIRSLAADLGVAPMSLYRHVRDKDDLLDEVVDRLLAGIWRPRAAKSDWRGYVSEAVERLRSFLVDQPAALYVFLRHPVVSPAATERMESLIAVLTSAGFSNEEAESAYATVHTYAIGFAALEASRAAWVPNERVSGALAEKLASYTSVERFGEGLAYLLDAIEARRGRPTPRRRQPARSRKAP